MSVTNQTPETAVAPKETTRKRAPKAKATVNPNLVYVTDQVVWAGHPRLHEQVTEAKILSDFHISSTYVRLPWVDDGQVALVHRNRVRVDEPAPRPVQGSESNE